jgi:hypothetical protein
MVARKIAQPGPTTQKQAQQSRAFPITKTMELLVI